MSHIVQGAIPMLKKLGVYPKLYFNWASCILSGNPVGEGVGQWDSKRHSEARDCDEGTDNLGEKTTGLKKLSMMLKSWWGKKAEDEELENH